MKKKIKILIVDDDPTLLKMIGEGLIDNDFEVIVADDPEQALKKIEKQMPEFALLDFDLGWPDKNGIQLGQDLKAISEEISIIIMTGYHNIQHAVNAMRQFSFHYMIKPFRIDQIISLVERVERERKLFADNVQLKELVDTLKEENERLQQLVNEYVPADKTKNITLDINRKSQISNANVQKSYERHQGSTILDTQKK